MMILALIRETPRNGYKDWQAKVKGLLKAELKRRNLSCADLAEKPGAIGIKGEERNISNRIGRGSFTAVFFGPVP
jgi:hypothetical protein